MQSAVGLMERYPTAAGQMLLAVDLFVGPTYEIAVLGNLEDEATKQILADLRRRNDVEVLYLPGK